VPANLNKKRRNTEIAAHQNSERRLPISTSRRMVCACEKLRKIGGQASPGNYGGIIEVEWIG
jgi:hypothetical protein